MATFLYRDGAISQLRFQFVQQTAPYLLRQHFVLWGVAAATLIPTDAGRLTAYRAEAQAELGERLPARPWNELVRQLPPGTLDGFGGPLKPQWRVEAAGRVALVLVGEDYVKLQKSIIGARRGTMPR